MSEFYKRFLMDEGRRLNPDTGRYIALGAFGKHPGWDDHVEDLGLDTESLNLAKRVLYVQGVGGQIDTGAWEKLKEDQRLPAFNHTFVWQRGDQFLAGRMWSSSDGKGRTRYPMIICAHAIGVPLAWVLDNVLPRLDEVEKACQATKSAEEVRAVLGRARTGLRNLIASVAAEGPRGTPDPSTLHQFVSAAPFGPANEGWFRILYWLQSQAKGFGPGKFNLRGDVSGLRAQQIRVPAGLPWPTQALLVWTRFFGLHVDRLVPALFVWPSSGDWIDATFGEPGTEEFFCLRAAHGAIPLATEVPYDFDQAFREQANRQMDDFEHRRPQRPTPASAPKAASADQPQGFLASVTQRWFKRGIFLIGLLVIAAIAVVLLTRSPSREKTGAEATRPPSAPAVSQTQRSPPTQKSAVPSPATPAEAGQASEPMMTNNAAAEQARQLEEQKQRSEAAAKAAAAAAARAEAQRQAEAEAAEKARVAAAQVEAKRVAEEKLGQQQAASATGASQTTVTSAPAAGNAASAPTTQATASPAGAASLNKTFTNGIGMVLLWVPDLPGSGQGGWVGKYEVTEKQYEKVTGMNPSKFADPDQPVEHVSWRDATNFCQRLGAAERAAGRLPQGFAYALPTRQQWTFFLDDARFADAVSSRDMESLRATPMRVGSRAPNKYGLYDVLGNVWEWCADGDAPGQKATMGGAYNNGVAFQFRALERTTERPLPEGAKTSDVGFRCVVVRLR